MTENEAAYHDHQRTIIKTPEQKQAYRTWLLAIEEKKRVRQESTEARRAEAAATEKARAVDRFYVEAIKKEREAWLTYEVTKL